MSATGADFERVAFPNSGPSSSSIFPPLTGLLTSVLSPLMTARLKCLSSPPKADAEGMDSFREGTDSFREGAVPPTAI